MTSKERIYKTLNFKTPDRIGIHDTFLKGTIKSWRRSGFPRDTTPQEYFDFDFEVFGIDKILKGEPSKPRRDKFTILSFTEPFQRLCDINGKENVLRNLGRHPKRFKANVARQTETILDELQSVMRKGLKFDGAWAWGDLAYNKGLLFSPSTYKDTLFPLHKKIFRFLSSQGLFILFHSDGNISDLVPYLLDLGVRAFHPLEENSGMDIYKLFRDYRAKMVFMGCIDIEKFIHDKSSIDELKRKINFFKRNASYIYQADCPIMSNISFEDYSRALEVVRKAGRY